MSTQPKSTYHAFLSRYLELSRIFGTQVQRGEWEGLEEFEREREGLIRAMEQASAQSAGELTMEEARERQDLIQQILKLDEELFAQLEKQIQFVREEVRRSRKAQDHVSRYRDGAGSENEQLSRIKSEV